MSYLEVYAVRPNGDIVEYGEAHNAFGGAMHIWMTLKDKYKVSGGLLEGFKVLWASIGKMQEVDQWVLASTFDNVIIPKEHLETFIHHLNTFIVETAYSNTLAEAINILKRALVDDEVQAIAFNQTSVNADTWRVALPDEDEEESTRPYNVNQDEGHWYLPPEYLQSKK